MTSLPDPYSDDGLTIGDLEDALAAANVTWTPVHHHYDEWCFEYTLPGHRSPHMMHTGSIRLHPAVAIFVHFLRSHYDL